MAAMYKRLSKELLQLRDKTLLNDGFALEAAGETEAAGRCAAAPGPAAPRAKGAGKAGDAGDCFVVLLAGPRDSPYRGGVFRLSVEVPPSYPMGPPKIKFVTRVFHPNVGRGHTPGAICLDILRKEAWSPALTLERTMISIASLLADPNPNSPMDSEAARLYVDNRPAYNRRVQEWVRQYARPTGAAADAGGAWEGDMGVADETDATVGEATSGASQGGRGAPAAAGGGAAPAWARPPVIDLDDSEDEGQGSAAEPPPKKPRESL